MEPLIEIKVLDHGSVALMNYMGEDDSPAKVARKSFRTKEEKTEEENRRLSRYLMKNWHNTPFEFNEAVFHIEMPICIARQWFRHRTASIDEESLRYVEARRVFYTPDISRLSKQSTNNKQGSSDEIVANPEEVLAIINKNNQEALDNYDKLIESGLAKELARMVLPVNLYTGFYWKCDLHNIFHLLALRMDSHAQWEIREYANAIYDILIQIWPNLMQDWMDLRGPWDGKKR